MTPAGDSATPRILLAEDVEPVEPVDGEPAAEVSDAPPEDPDALPIPRPLLFEGL